MPFLFISSVEFYGGVIDVDGDVVSIESCYFKRKNAWERSTLISRIVNRDSDATAKRQQEFVGKWAKKENYWIMRLVEKELSHISGTTTAFDNACETDEAMNLKLKSTAVSLKALSLTTNLSL